MSPFSKNSAILSLAAPHWVAGIGIPQARAHQRSPEALFLRPQFMAGCMGAPSGAPLLVRGNANSVRPATLLIGINGGGSQLHEDTTMPENQATFCVFPSALSGTTQTDTQNNVCAVLSFIQAICDVPPGEAITLESEAAHGLGLILDSAIYALKEARS